MDLPMKLKQQSCIENYDMSSVPILDNYLN